MAYKYAHTKKLRALGACSEALEFADKYPSLQKAWDACLRSSWLIWLLTDGNHCNLAITESRCINCKLSNVEAKYQTAKGRCNAIRRLYPKAPKLAGKAK